MIKAAIVAGLVVAPLVLAPVAQARCDQFAFGGFVIMNQNNGYRVEFPGGGTHIQDSPAIVFNNRQAVVNHGSATGDITNRAINFRIIWDNGTVGNYSGSVTGLDNGKARGTSGDATWNFKDDLPCAPH